MRALRIESFSETATVVLRDVPLPAAGQGEVEVRILAAGVNPSDARNAQGRMPQTTPPRTPGRDFAGVLEDGTPVFGSGGDLGFTREGTHAERVVLPRAACIERPGVLSVEQAAACGVPYATAYESVLLKCALKPGETLLVVGGGAVGEAAAQLARWTGASAVLATRRDPRSVEPGAFDEVVSMDALPSVDVVLNTVGGASFQPSTLALRQHGRMACIAADMNRKEVSFDVFRFYRQELSFFGIDSLGHTCVNTAAMLRAMLPGFASGALVPPTPVRVPLSEGPAVFAKIIRGGDHEKRVLVP